ncbi:YHYH protein [Oligoflexaceae bacterium]|nr:YHYH protein [Oligoflexaceae bacterium]
MSLCSLSLIASFVACDSKSNDRDQDPVAEVPADDLEDDGTGDGTDDSLSGLDITNAIFEKRSSDCKDYIGEYYATVTDKATNTVFNSKITMSDDGDTCSFSSNSIPNHDFNDGSKAFVNKTKEVNETFSLIAEPTVADSSTSLTLDYDNGIFLNGAKLDVLAAACYGVGNAALGKEKVGCNDMSLPWRYDPMYSGNTFSTDTHNAHTQPDGAYHYHGSPAAMWDDSGSKASPVIGFAADGFPIYGPWIDDNGSIRKVKSGYTVKSGSRSSQTGEGAFPGGDYDGTFRDDYEYTSAGDLDECNGMTKDGSYGYYVTDSFPYVIGCFTGTPHLSFKK